MIGFDEFFSAVHRGEEPYPWQSALAERCVSGAPPDLIAVPTGAGKTATIDALLWSLASQAELPAAERSVGVRMVWAIDRRILVDQVHQHAVHLVSALSAALDNESDPLHDVAVALRGLAGSRRPLVATRWRGGIADEAELLYPTQPQIITSTVAQIGSRLLFRGYGVGRGSLALEAGLAACDTTICLDEAHLATPFAQTVEAIRKRFRSRSAGLNLPPLHAITLTATPTEERDSQMRLGPEDEDALGQRLTGRKWATLDESASNDRERAALIVDAAKDYVTDGASTVACVVNTVKQARAVFNRLVSSTKRDARDIDLALLIGPQRPVDRERALTGPAAALFADEPPPKPLICVATQTFEVGLDADVAAVVTESASATALTQRLGRLNRRGERVGFATIVRDPDCWLYAEDEPLAWEWLVSRRRADGRIDVSVAAMDADQSRPAPIRTATAPELTDAIIELLVQTNPRLGFYQEPDVEVFFRGAESEQAADVTLCWRCDLHPELTDETAAAYRRMLLELVPPDRSEQLSISVRAARALIHALHSERPTRSARAAALSDADVEGTAPPIATRDGGAVGDAVPFVVIRGNEVLHGAMAASGDDEVSPADLLPGDAIVLPTSAGGIDEHGLSPASRAEASDEALDRQGDTGAAVRISQRALDLAPAVPRQERTWRAIARLCSHAEAARAERERPSIQELVGRLHDVLPDEPGLQSAAEAAASGDRYVLRSVTPVDPEPVAEVIADESAEVEAWGETDILDELSAPSPAEQGIDYRAWVLVPVPRRRRDRDDRAAADPPPTIEAHATAVASQAVQFCGAVGVPPRIAGSIELAARAHDHGKADPRIQAFYRRGVAALGAPPVAKSEFGTHDPRTAAIAARLAGLPSSLHHEIHSTAILADALDRGAIPDLAVDEMLTLHLVAVHHGRGRPIPDVPRGGAPPRRFTCNASGVAGSALGDGGGTWTNGSHLRCFWKTINTYGAWGAAYLEAILMLADRIVSSEGS